MTTLISYLMAAVLHAIGLSLPAPHLQADACRDTPENISVFVATQAESRKVLHPKKNYETNVIQVPNSQEYFFTLNI